MTKRKAEYELNRKELEENDFELTRPTAATPITQNAPVDISQRRVVKIKLPSEILKENHNNNEKPAKFSLVTPLVADTQLDKKAQENKAAVSFLNKIVTPPSKEGEKSLLPETMKSEEALPKLAQPEPIKIGTEEEKPKETPKVSLFANLFGNQPSTASSLFSNSNSLFAKNSGVLSTLFTTPDANAAPSLFAGLFQTKPNEPEKSKPVDVEPPQLPKAQEKKEESSKPKGLFNNFMQANLPSASGQSFSLFAKAGEGAPTFKSLLSGESAPKSFFATKAKEDDEQDEEGGSGDDEDAEGVRSPSPEPDQAQTSSKYQYDEPFEKIIAKDVEKFKAGTTCPLLGKGVISLSRAKESEDYFIVFRNSAKLLQYQGRLIKQHSTVAYMQNKLDSLNIVAISSQAKGDKDDKKLKFSKDMLKVMFTTNEGAEEFKKEVEKCL